MKSTNMISNLDDRPEPGHRGAQSGPQDRGLADRGVADPVRAEAQVE
jgi:hypothetical protein